MTGQRRAPATRSNLLRDKRRLDQVTLGTRLLKRKRQSLVDELFARARPAIASREAIEAEAQRAWSALWRALAAQGAAGVTPLSWPTREIDVDLSAVELWGVRVATLGHRPTLVRSLAARGILPGLGEAASQQAAGHFETLIERLLDAAPQEQAMRRLGQALAQTTRLVNTLEQRVAVNLTAEIVAIARALNEREREEHQRIKRLIARRQAQSRHP
ncbi:MAG TPA: V-type ATP synthase subunit D [Vicinamibacterales bacterium]|nr:V-type ATP synthase subunit D [Vicinamibacterales bacterium]